MKFRAPLFFLCCVGMCCSAFGSAALYRRYKARRTFGPEKGVHNPFGRSDVLAVDFVTTGFAQPDGSDIRVFAGRGGRAADFKVMMMGPGDRARVAVRMLAGVREYHVCYGGPKNPRPSAWEPKVGLILETRKFNGGNVKTAAQMRTLVDASGPRYGRWFVPNIFHGFNLFGPSDGYVSIYRGWLHIPKAGTYRFTTTSDDASYFVVGGKIVSAKPSWGRGPANARFAGAARTLAAGAHQVDYYHVEGNMWQFCVAAWQLPGEKFRTIPPRAFPGVFTAKQVDLQIAGSAVPIDLTWQDAGCVVYEGHRLYKVQFSDASPRGASRACTPRWLFGDGTSSDKRHPEHVYLSPGEHTVTFTLSRGRTVSRIRQKIVVAGDWEHQGQKRRDTAARYAEILADYDFKSMSSEGLDKAFEFFVTLGRDGEVIKTASALLAKNDERAAKKAYRCAVYLGERLRDLKNEPHEALAVFRAAIERETDEAKTAKLIRRVGDTLLYALHKPDEALAEYRKVLDRYGKLEDNVVRLAQIRAGDAYKAKGDHARAMEAYNKAKSMLSYKRSHAVSSVRRGAFAQSIEGYLRRKQFGEAQNLLNVWGWEHPTDRIAGEWSLMAAKVALAKGDKGSAAREALESVRANKTGHHADALLLFAGRIYADEGRGAEAIKIGRRIQKEHPESPLQEEALLLECRGLYLNKQYHEAAKKATQAAEKYGAGESGPAFLMIAANAAFASGDKKKGIGLLQVIVRDHPRSKEAKAARVRLKALGVE